MWLSPGETRENYNMVSEVAQWEILWRKWRCVDMNLCKTKTVDAQGMVYSGNPTIQHQDSLKTTVS